MRTRIQLSLVALPLIAQAQSVSLLNQGLNDAVRRAQLWGSVPATASSFCVRPVHATRALGFTDPYSFDAKYDFTQPGDDTTKPLLPKYQYEDWVFVRATPILVRAQLNSHHDYGWQDGPMIPNKGMQTYLNGGIYGRLLKSLIEFQYAPELVSAENRDLPAPGVRNSRGDFPDRFGTDPYRRTYTGQSYIKLNVDFLSAGFSTENVAWGPGRFSSVIMSENAPGMGHFSLASNKPIKTSKWGLVIKARPMANICCSPPESWLPIWWLRSANRGKRAKTRSKVQGEIDALRLAANAFKFSVTLKVGKIKRPSGTTAIPMRAIRSGLSWSMRSPKK